MQQAQDFLDETNALHALVGSLDHAGLDQKTAFKGWTINEIIRHLHFWNRAAHLSLLDADGFETLFSKVSAGLAAGNARGGRFDGIY